MIKLSIYLPINDKTKKFDMTVKSVLFQSFKDFELIVDINKKYNDIIKEIKKFNDSRIRILENNGLKGFYSYIDRLIQNANGELCAFILPGDVWQNNKLYKQIEYLERNINCGAVFTNINLLDINGEKKDNIYYLESNKYDKYKLLNYLYFHGNCFCLSSVIIRIECIKENNNSNFRFIQLGDLHKWVKLLENWNIYIINEYLTNCIEKENLKKEEFKQSTVEEYWILELYFKKNIEEIKCIFPELMKYDNELTESNIIIYLAEISIHRYKNQSNYLVRKALAINKVFELFSDERIIINMLKYDYLIKERFYQITQYGLYNIGNIESYKNEEEIKSIDALIDKFASESGSEYLKKYLKKHTEEYFEKRVGIKYLIKLLIKKVLKKIIKY